MDTMRKGKGEVEYGHRGSNPGSSACEADVIATRAWHGPEANPLYTADTLLPCALPVVRLLRQIVWSQYCVATSSGYRFNVRVVLTADLFRMMAAQQSPMAAVPHQMNSSS